MKYNILQSENEKKAKRITELEHKLQQLKQNVDDNNCMMQFMAIKMKEKELQCDEFKKFIDMLFNRIMSDRLDKIIQLTDHTN